MLRRLLFLGLLLCSAALAAESADTALERLLAQAEKEAPEEVQLHIIKTYHQLSSFLAKVRHVEQVQGWQQISVVGEAAFASWDGRQRDFVWHGGKFEVLFDVVDGKKLKLNTVTFDGRSSRPD